MFKKSLLAAFVTAASLPVIAGVQNINDEIIVTATRTPVAIHKALSSVSILTRQDIERAQASDLNELLGTLVGIESVRNGSRGSLASIRLRGSESDHTLILVDGVRISNATSGNAGLSQIPVSQIERIEVVRGPKSSLYGAEAIGGVVQVFTRKGGEQITPFFEVESGSHNLKKSVAGVTGSINSFKLSAVAAHEESDGIDSTPFFVGSANNDKDGFRQSSFSSSIDYDLSADWNIGVDFKHVKSDVDIDQVSKLDRSELLNQLIGLRVRGNLTEDLSLTMTVNQSKDESETFGTYPSVYNTKRKGSTAQLDYVFTEGQLLTLGYDYYDDQVDSTEPFSETSRDNKAVFAQYQGSFGRFSTALSVREDDNQSFGKYTTESASIGYSITDEVLVSLSYGTAFKAPSFNDLYYPSSDFAFFGTTYRYTGNPDVQPESSKSTELMLRGLHDSFHWSISLYQTEIEDLISVDDLFTSPSLVISAPSNISEAELTGAEVEVGTSLWGWNGTASLSYVDPMDKSDDSMLRRRSRGKADFRVDRDFDQLNFMVFWQAQSYRYDGANASDRLSGFNTVNIRASYTVNPKLELALKVNNIFDDEYKVLKDYNTDGMSAAVSAKYTF